MNEPQSSLVPARAYLSAITMAVLVTACASTPTTPERVEDELDTFEQKLMEHEEAISTCMKREGFDYIAALPSDWYLERAYQEDVASGGDGNTSVSVPQNPNDAIFGSLTELEREAYLEAYWGDQEAGGQDEGCYYETYTAVWGPNVFTDVSQAEAEDVLAAIEHDQRVVKAQDEFNRCMGQEGFDVNSVDGVYELIDRAYADLQETAGHRTDDPAQLPGFEQFESMRAQAIEAQETCESDFYKVYDSVQEEYVQQLLDGLG